MKYYAKSYSLNDFPLSTPEEEKNAAKRLVADCTEAIQIIYTKYKNKEDLSDYLLTKRNAKSGLTKQAGVYLLLNITRGTIYIGSSSSLAQRKGELARDFKNPNRRGQRSVINPGIRQDLIDTPLDDYYFIPLVIFSTSEKTPYELSVFLDNYVESQVIAYCFENSELKTRCLNTREVGRFKAKNTYGGTPQSGALDRPVGLKIPGTNNFICVWESVSAAAKSLDCANKTIRNRRDAGLLIEVSTTFYEAFPGPKISNANATTFFENSDLETRVRLILNMRKR
jgi:hypothetical protein